MAATTCFPPPPPALSLAEMATSVTELRQVHAHMLKTGHFRDPFTASRLVAFAATNPDPQIVSYAHSIFNQIDHPTSFTWNAIIRSYANSPNPQTALSLFRQMLRYATVFPDNYTFTFALKACAGFSGLREGRQVHGHVLKVGADCDPFIQTTLVRMYGANGSSDVAREVFDKMPTRDVYAWNALLSPFVERGEMGLAREVFDEMGERNVESWNFMISGYVSVGLVDEGRHFFDEMPVRNVVSWNVMIAAYADVGCLEQVMLLFEDMQKEDLKPDNCILVKVLSACANSGALCEGEMVRAYIDENGIKIAGVLATALVDMYIRCGSIEKGLEVLKNTSRKDISIWNSVIEGLNNHGFAENALRVFSEMVVEGFKPNEDTFMSILSACSRARMLNLERKIFKIVRTMPQEEGCVVWGALLSACKNHGNSKMTERVAKKLLEFSSQGSAQPIL